MIDRLFKYFRRLVPFKIKRIAAFFRDKINNIFSVIIIETSSACNRRCAYCPNSKFDRGLVENDKRLDAKVFYKIIDELVLLKWFGQIQFNFYNEPLLDERLPEFIKLAKLKLPASSVVVYTNGDFLTIDLYEKFRDAGVNDFIITRHPETGPDNIKKLLDFRRLKGSQHVKVVYRKLDRFYSRGGLIALLPEKKKSKRCLWGTYNLIINHKGEAVLCCEDYFNTIGLGNVAHERLVDIWNKAYYKQIRHDLKMGIFKNEICRKCGSGRLG